jgi:hypothetical protein
VQSRRPTHPQIGARSAQPAREVHGPCQNDEKAPKTLLQQRRPMVPSSSARRREQAAGHPQRETSRPLPILCPTDELPQSAAVLSGCPMCLEEMATPKIAGKDPHLASLLTASFGHIRFCAPGSRDLGPARRVLPEEPTAVVLHGGVCDGGGSTAQLCCLILPYSAARVTANFAMVPKFEEFAKNRRGVGKMGGAGRVPPDPWVNLNKRLLTTELGTLED